MDQPPGRPVSPTTPQDYKVSITPQRTVWSPLPYIEARLRTVFGTGTTRVLPPVVELRIVETKLATCQGICAQAVRHPALSRRRPDAVSFSSTRKGKWEHVTD